MTLARRAGVAAVALALAATAPGAAGAYGHEDPGAPTRADVYMSNWRYCGQNMCTNALGGYWTLRSGTPVELYFWYSDPLCNALYPFGYCPGHNIRVYDTDGTLTYSGEKQAVDRDDFYMTATCTGTCRLRFRCDVHGAVGMYGWVDFEPPGGGGYGGY